MKKIISILLCIQLVGLPVLADYDFSDEAQAEFDRKNYNLTQPGFTEKKTRHEIKNEPLLYPIEDQNYYFQPIEDITSRTQYSGQVVEIPSGTSFYVTFDSGISSVSLDKNDRLTASLTNDLRYNGALIASSGSLVYGNVTNATSAGYAYGAGNMELSFDEILTSDGNRIKISTEKITMQAKSERAKKMTRDVVVGALASMLVGAAFTALGGGDNWGRNMAVYGGIGALGGGIRGAMNHGENVQIPSGTTVLIRLNRPVQACPCEQFNF